MSILKEITLSRREFLERAFQAGVVLGSEPSEVLRGLERLSAPSWHYGQVQIETVNIRPIPNYLKSKPIGSVKSGAVLKLENEIIQGKDGLLWRKIVKNHRLRWPSKTDEYVWADALATITDFDPIHPWVNPEDKKIVISLEKQSLVAYEGEQEVLRTLISAGKAPYRTPTGEHEILYKRMERQMQGRYILRPKDNYDLRGVPFCWYFRPAFAGHGAWWHNNFGQPMSHGCLNVSLLFSAALGMSPAEFLFRWTTPEFELSDTFALAKSANPGTRVIIKKSL